MHAEIEGARTAEQALARGFGRCADYCLVFAAFAADAGFPVRMVTLAFQDPGGLPGGGTADSHSMVGVLMDGAWGVFDPAHNCYLAGTSEADLIREPQRGAEVVRLPVTPGLEWGYRYFSPAYLGHVTTVWVANGPTGAARQVFRAAEYVADIAIVDEACGAHSNAPIIFGGTYLPRWLRAVAFTLQSRGRLPIIGADPVLNVVRALARRLPGG